MASIMTSINLVDRMSAPLRNIGTAVEGVIELLQNVDSATQKGFDTAAIDSARRSIDLANAEIEEMAAELESAKGKQDGFNKSVHSGEVAMGGLSDKVMAMVSAYAGFKGVQKMVQLSDSVTQTTARLKLMNKGSEDISELQQKIFESAQRSRTAYLDMADVVAKLGLRTGNLFKSNDEIIAFSENLNKSFVIAGSSQQEMASASLQLTQALGSGTLQGQELKAVFEAAPNIIQRIADYMGVAIGSVKELASEGQITAETVKNAMLSVTTTEDINAQFNSMPMTWGQVWTEVCNQILMVSQPLLEFISFLAQNWSVLQPIVLAVAFALGLYTSALLIHKGILGAAAIAQAIHTAFTTKGSIATAFAATSQQAFNAALLACPLTWIILLIIAIIAIIYAVVAAINKVTGSTYSATGIIMGILNVAAAFVGNLFIALINFVLDLFAELYNFIVIFANFFANVFKDPVGAVARLFFDLVDNVLGLLQSLASAIDTLFGSNLASSVQGWRDSLGGWVDKTFGKGEEIIAKVNAEEMHLNRFEYSEAWDKGYQFGQGIENKVQGWFGGNGLKDQMNDLNLDDIPAFNGASHGKDMKNIADNTDKIANSVSANSEELKYLRMIAERQVINKFTTAEVKIDMTGMRNVLSSGADIDGMVNQVQKKLAEAMLASPKGVHI